MMESRRMEPAARLLGSLLCLAVLLPQPVHSAAEAPGADALHIDLDASTFNATLLALPSSAPVLMEFYASWCPHCRHFKPHYEKVAAHCGRHTAGGQRVWVFRVDCAVEVKLCGSYKIGSYPTLYLSTAAEMLAANASVFSKFDYRKFAMDANGTLAWVAQELHTEWQELGSDASMAQQEQQQQQEGQGPAAVRPPIIAHDMKWTLSDVEEATQQLLHQVATTPALQQGGNKRSALASLLKLWGEAHPSKRCRHGSQSVALRLNAVWPLGADMPAQDLASLHVCGRASRSSSSRSSGSRNYRAGGSLGGSSSSGSSNGGGGSSSSGSSNGEAWVACKGSLPGARGFTCGLWLLFHTTAARVAEADGGRLFMDALRQWAQQLFMCSACAQHFQGVLARPAAVAVQSRRDAMLWLWRAHNEINVRLAKEEALEGRSTAGDPAHPKRQWPSPALCPLCRLPQLPLDTDVAVGSGGSSSGSSGSGSSANDISRSSSGSGDDSSRNSNESGVDGAGSEGWNEEEVVRFLQRYYGHSVATDGGNDSDSSGPGQQPSSIGTAPGRVRFGRGGVQALRLTRSRGVSSEPSEAAAKSSTGRFSMALLLMLAVVVYYFYSRSVRRPSRSGYAAPRLQTRLF